MKDIWNTKYKHLYFIKMSSRNRRIIQTVEMRNLMICRWVYTSGQKRLSKKLGMGDVA